MAKIIQDSSDIIRELQPNNVDLQLKLSNNVKNKFEYLEKALPHEDATGTDITMNNTAEYYIRTREIDGDTEQIITTGKNLFDKNNYMINSASVTRLSTGVRMTTIDSGAYKYSSFMIGKDELLGKTITIHANMTPSANNKPLITIYMGNASTSSISGVSNAAFGESGSKTVTLPNSFANNTDRFYLLVYSNAGGTEDVGLYVDYTDLQVELGSSYTSYEPYTGGIPGPNPDYPQEVKVVKGINLWQNSDYYTQLTTANYTITETGFTFTRNTLTGGKYISKKIPVESGKTYIFSADLVRDPASDLILYLYRGNVYGTQLAASTTDVLTYTATADEELYFTFIINSGLQTATVSNIQVQTGERTSYLPYKSIGLNVASKNLFILPNNITQNGITYQKNEDGTFNISGTATANTNIYISIDLSNTNINNGTYTISKKSAGYNTQIDLYNNTTWVATPIYVYGNNLNSTATITIPSNITKIRFIIYVANGNSINLTNEHIQLEKSSTATEYVPYHSDVYPLYLGDTELCKIDGYQDCFKKSTGKNLFDNSSTPVYLNTATTQKINTGIRVIDTAGSGNNHFALFKVLDVSNHVGKTFSIKMQFQSSGANQGQFVVGLCDENGGNRIASKWGTTSGQEVSFTIPTLTTSNYMAIWLYSNASGTATANDYVNYTNIMINEGSTASEYEPYGIGVWYLHKEIGKKVLDGTDSVYGGGTTGTNAYYCETNITAYNDNSKILAYSDMFGPVTFNNRNNGLDATYVQNGEVKLRTANNTTIDWSDNAKRKAWITANKPTVYYVLANPTDNVITDATLLRQLQYLDNAISYEGTTYLTTLGNLPPIVDIIYTQDIKKLIAAATQS